MLLASALRPRASSDWWDESSTRWGSPWLGMGPTDAGISIGPETIFSCAAVYAAIRFKSEAVAMCTPQLGIRVGPGRRQEDPDHPVQDLLLQPTAWLTGYDWTCLQVFRLSVFGDSYNRILRGPKYFAGELRPIHPTLIKPVDQARDGSLIYEHRPMVGVPERLSADEVLHYMGPSMSGFTGLAPHVLIRNMVGVALAIEKHTGSFMKHGTRLSGILSKDGDLSASVQKELGTSWAESFGGNNNVGGIAVLGGGFKFTPLAVDHQKSQLTELDDQVTSRILMALGVPGVVVGWQGDKASTYASAKSFFQEGGLRGCIQPIVTQMDQRDRMSLLIRGDKRYVKRNLDVLMRSNTTERIASLVAACGGPIMTANEARAIEDLNPIDDPENDELRSPAGVAPDAPEPEPEPAARPRRRPVEAPPAEDEQAALMRAASATVGILDAEVTHLRARVEIGRALAERNARGLVRSEIEAIVGAGKNGKGPAAERLSADPVRWKTWVTEFYDRYSARVATTMVISEYASRGYAAEHRDAVLRDLAVIETWPEVAVPQLVALWQGSAPPALPERTSAPLRFAAAGGV